MSPELLAVRRERMRVLAEELSRETGIPVSCILGTERDALVVAVRHRLWVMLHETGLSLSAVAAIAGRDNKTVLMAIRKCRDAARAVTRAG